MVENTQRVEAKPPETHKVSNFRIKWEMTTKSGTESTHKQTEGDTSRDLQGTQGERKTLETQGRNKRKKKKTGDMANTMTLPLP